MFREKLYLRGGILSWAHEDMIKQKAISARIRHETLWRVDQEAALGYQNRNAILNDGADMYCHAQDIRRELKMHADLATRKKILYGFLAIWIPEGTQI